MNTEYETSSPERESSAAYVADPADYIGLPAPDLGAVSTFVHGDAELETRVREVIHQREQGPASIMSRRLAARQIIALVREHDRRASHEGPTVSAEVAAVVAERFQGGER